MYKLKKDAGPIKFEIEFIVIKLTYLKINRVRI